MKSCSTSLKVPVYYFALVALFVTPTSTEVLTRPILPQLQCPTIGTDAYIMLSVTPQVDLSGFASMLEFYAKLMPLNTTSTTTFNFYFGTNYSTVVTTHSLQQEVHDWVNDDNYISLLYASSLVQSKSLTQYDTDEDSLCSVARKIFEFVSKENQQSDSLIRKKQVVLITDYVDVNVTDVMNKDQNVNTQLLGLYHEIHVKPFDDACNFPVYSVEDENLTALRKVFQGTIDFEFPSLYEAKPLADVYVFMTSLDHPTLTSVAHSVVDGSECQLSANKMYSSFMHAQLAHNDTLFSLVFPWLGSRTKVFIDNCIAHLPSSGEAANCSHTTAQVVNNYISQVSVSSNLTYLHLYIDDVECINATTLLSKLRDSTHIRLITSSSLDSVYESLTLPLLNLGFLGASVDNQVVHNDEYYLTNFTTTCRNVIPMVSLVPATPWRRPKYLHIALDDMLWIVICASISVSTFGVIIYRHVKRQIKKRQEILNEIMLQPRLFKVAKECPKVARLPWEIKSENVHIDQEFLLGEGTISNVYLGKLKGKAPIMQWIERVEMKQFQDCAVAVRVPRHFDEPEEDQLQREIASMRQLRHHDHIALLLGWTNKNDLVCSLLELTHMNLIKYLAQIKETVVGSETLLTTSYVPFQTLYKIVWEICDGMAYIHARNLVHRDLTARNILLTTGLRAKISGFGFCSEPDDPKFAANSLALRYLPVRWLAPESFKGKFSAKSDSWSFGVLMYEMFTLGDQPYEDLNRPEEIIQSVQKSRIPAHPKFASKQTYHIMQGCFQMFASRRPTFLQLKDAFHIQTHSYYHNPAFEPDDI